MHTPQRWRYKSSRELPNLDNEQGRKASADLLDGGVVRTIVPWDDRVTRQSNWTSRHSNVKDRLLGTESQPEFNFIGEHPCITVWVHLRQGD